MAHIILFDGVCNFCNSSIQFIIKRDPKGYYKFASLQSEIGRELLGVHHLSEEIDSVVLIEGDKCYVKSTAALRICKHLKGGWRFLGVFIIIPKWIRDFGYNVISKNRYKWFGKTESCIIPSTEIRSRFLN